MPAVIHHRQADVPIDELWDYVHDLSNWAKEIPGYVAHTEIDADESIWTVKGDVGALSKQVDFRVRVTERVAPSRVAFSLEGTTENVSGQGAFEARPAGAARPAAPTAPAPPTRTGWFPTRFQQLVRRLFRRTFAGPIAVAPIAAGAAGTEFSFSLELSAGGMMGPVVNALLEPLLLPAAVELADKIAGAVERG